MSVHVQVGQCGNQVGAAYWQLAAASDRQPAGNARSSLSRHLFHPSRTARCILVDSEPKVVRAVCENGVQPAHAHVEQAGRGNNWAMGYNGPRLKAAAPAFTSLAVDDRGTLVDQVMDSLRREIESVDCYQGSVVMHSLGGGTGSGLGCRLLETMRDTYPRAYIVTASVAPSCQCGDTPLQNYNALLTLKCLNELADAVIYKENDELLRVATYWKSIVHGTKQKSGGNGVRVSLEEMNSMAAADLAGLVFPVAPASSSTTRPFDFGKLMHDVCPMPAAKILDVRSGVWRDRGSAVRNKLPTKTASDLPSTLFHAPIAQQVSALSLRHERISDYDESLDMLERLVQQTTQTFPRGGATLASSAIVRGYCPDSFPQTERDKCTNRLNELIAAALPIVPWAASSQTALSYSKPAPFPALRAKASVTICANNGSFVLSAKHFVERARRQFQANAYVHWYKQHGLEDADFEAAFDECATLISDYKTLTG